MTDHLFTERNTTRTAETQANIRNVFIEENTPENGETQANLRNFFIG